jgi:hypothetical protein
MALSHGLDIQGSQRTQQYVVVREEEPLLEHPEVELAEISWKNEQHYTYILQHVSLVHSGCSLHSQNCWIVVMCEQGFLEKLTITPSVKKLLAFKEQKSKLSYSQKSLMVRPSLS